eukprot:scaffold49404_cov56-Attheya_sp.AAC.3
MVAKRGGHEQGRKNQREREGKKEPSYEGAVGIGEDNDVEMNPDDGITPKAIAKKMRGESARSSP